MANKTEFRQIPGAESHEVNRLGAVRRRVDPARCNGARNQFRPGYMLRAKGDMSVAYAERQATR